MAEKNEQLGVNQDYLGNRLLQKGEESVSIDVIITPPAFATNQNDYNPTDLQKAAILKLTSVGNNNITGIVAPDTARYKELIIINISVAANITLIDNLTSTAANRFLFGGNIILNANRSVRLIYDQVSQRWRATDNR